MTGTPVFPVSYPSLTILADISVGFHLSHKSSPPLGQQTCCFFLAGPRRMKPLLLFPPKLGWKGHQCGGSGRKASGGLRLGCSDPELQNFSRINAFQCFLVDFQMPKMVILTISGRGLIHWPLHAAIPLVSYNIKPHALDCFFVFVFLGPHPRQMEISRLGAESEL